MTFKGGWNICATVDHEEITAAHRQRDDDILTGEDDLVVRKGDDDDMTEAEAASGGAAQLKQMLENADNHGGWVEQKYTFDVFKYKRKNLLTWLYIFEVLSFYFDILDDYRLPNGAVNSGDLPNGDVLMKVTIVFYEVLSENTPQCMKYRCITIWNAQERDSKRIQEDKFRL